MAQMICSSCGHQGRPKKVTRGSFVIEIILWLFFLLPGLIYSLWRIGTTQKVCRKCKNPTMIPINSPIGQQMITRQQQSA